MKRSVIKKKTELNDFTKFKIGNPKFIFGGGDPEQEDDDGGPIDRKKLKKPGITD